MKKKITIICSILLVLVLSGCGKNDTSEGTLDKISYKETEEVTNFIKIDTNQGIMLLELYPDVAPITVANFQKLVSERFYDNLTFHRVSPGFVIQGGDPTGTGFGGSDETITGEFAANSIPNSLSHKKGVISMARSEDNDSASSQFFICSADATLLDGKYAAFGELIAGEATLDKIATTKVNNETPVQTQKIKSIRFVKIEKK